MIRINLIAQNTSTQKQTGGSLELAVIVLLIALGGGVVFYLWNDMEDRIGAARVKVKEEQATIKHLGRATATLKRFQAKEQELKRQLGIINKLRRKKQGPVRVLDQISVRIPKEVWVKSIRQRRKGNVIVLTGEAENNESVAIFLKRLEDSPYFDAVDLQQIVRRSYREGKNVTSRTIFSVNCKVRFAVQDT